LRRLNTALSMMTAESALAAHMKKTSKLKENKPQPDVTCKNCDRPGRSKSDCWSKGGGKEGQGPRQKKKGKTNKTINVVTDDENSELFTFTCMSDCIAVANFLDVLKSRLGMCISSGASWHYCPDRTKFTDYKQVKCKIMMADGRMLTTVGIRDLHIKLPNGSGKMKTILKNAIHAPEMAFTLIFISRLDKAGFSITFNKGMCTIKDRTAKTIATIPNSNGLYRIAAAKQSSKPNLANVISGKMSISKAHRKLGHISPHAIKHAISSSFITRITLYPDSKPEFCEACAKAKSTWQFFPKESNTRAENFGERVHWDLWGPA
jgi:GAG-pre-integrase domain